MTRMSLNEVSVTWSRGDNSLQSFRKGPRGQVAPAVRYHLQRRWDVRNFMATVLGVIAAGVMLIAYGLLSPRLAATEAYRARPILASERIGDIEDLTPRQSIAYPVNEVRALPVYDTSRRSTSSVAPLRTASRSTRSTRNVVRESGRDWKQTAMVIGGSTAAGAGLGAIFGGKKGALIGAAIGGGAGTLFEVKRR
jgi:hypothetical protein